MPRPAAATLQVTKDLLSARRLRPRATRLESGLQTERIEVGVSFSIRASTSASTLTLSRTVCCESYKLFGKRCALCPNRGFGPDETDRDHPPLVTLSHAAAPPSSVYRAGRSNQ